MPDELCAANLRERDGGRVEVFARARLALRLRGEEERAEVDREVYCEERDRDRVGAGGWHCEVCRRRRRAARARWLTTFLQLLSLPQCRLLLPLPAIQAFLFPKVSPNQDHFYLKVSKEQSLKDLFLILKLLF